MALLAIILSLCLVCKMLNVHFLEIMATLMMTMTTENHLAMPPLPLFYLPFTPTTSKKKPLQNSWKLQPNVTFISRQHLTLLAIPSS